MRNRLFFILMAFFILQHNTGAAAVESALEESHEKKPQTALEDNSKISFDIKGMDIVDVLKMLATRAGMNIVIGKNVTGRVTLFLKEVNVADAFEIILLANDLAYDKKADIINIMTQKEYEVIFGEHFQEKKIAKIIPLKNARAVDLARALTQMKSNSGRIVVDEGSNTLALIDTPQSVVDMQEFINNTDLAVQTKIFSLNYAKAADIQAKIQEAVTKTVGSVKMDERTNKVAVTDYPAKLESISEIIAAFDEKTPQVLIDAQIVEITPKKDQFSYGIDWDYFLKQSIRFTGALPAPSLTDNVNIPNKLFFGVVDPEADSTGQSKAIINLLRVIGETKILSSPRIMTLNNTEAKILVGTKEAFITSATSLNGQTSVTSQSVNFVDVGIKLYVTPTINKDGFVTMKIRPEISSSKQTDIVSAGQITQIPIVTTSESESTVMLKDGATIIIAGLKRDLRNKETKKFPVLGDIPLLGFLFRSVKNEVIKTELVVFITPHIVTGEQAFEYKSLTNDIDIESIQKQAMKK